MRGQPPLTFGRAVVLAILFLLLTIVCLTAPLWFA